MALQESEIRSILVAQLSPAERERAVVYKSSTTVPPGKLNFGAIELPVPWRAWVAFVDFEPGANWGHSSRYILVNIETGEVASRDARFPPFQSNVLSDWLTIYQGPSAPDWAVAAPKAK